MTKIEIEFLEARIKRFRLVVSLGVVPLFLDEFDEHVLPVGDHIVVGSKAYEPYFSRVVFLAA